MSNGYKNEVFLIVYFSLHFEAFESFQRLVLSSFDDEINILGSVHHILKIGNHLSMDFLSFSSSEVPKSCDQSSQNGEKIYILAPASRVFQKF